MNAALRLRVVLTSLVMAPACVVCQQPRQYTDADYANAEKFMAYNVNPLAYKGQVNAQWLDDDRFWYREVDDNGTSYIAVDPAKGTRAPLFNHERLASNPSQRMAPMGSICSSPTSR
jgi:dipeptidyl-peptidase 4